MNETLMKLLGSSNTKISYFVHSVMDEYIGGLQIPVYDIKFVQIAEPLANLKKHIHKFIQPIDRGPTILLILLRIRITIIQQISQIPAITVLRHYIEELICLCVSGKCTLSASSYLTMLGCTNDFRMLIYLFISC